MKLNLKTISLIIAVIVLLVSTIGITLVLRNDSSSAPTTAKKVKASSQTYTKVISLAQPTSAPTAMPTAGISLAPTGTAVFSAGASLSPTAVPTAVPTSVVSTPVPTTVLLASNITPTETILAAVPAATGSASTLTTTPTSAPLTSLPQTGWMQASLVIFISAATLIFVSFLY